MQHLVTAQTSLMPQTSDLKNASRSARYSTFKVPLKNPLPFAPQYSESEHRKRILEWATTTKPTTPDSLYDDDDSVAAQSFLIDEGVQKLREWDDEESKRNDPNTKGIAAAKRLDLISDLKKIKRSIDPEDGITPRIIVQEFEKFIDTKKSTQQPKKVKKLTKKIPQPNKPKSDDESAEVEQEKRVSFHAKVSEQETKSLSLNNRKSNWRKNLSKTRVGFSIKHYPNTNKNVMDKNGKLELHKQMGPVLPNNDPLWWKRKIRQGFLQTDEMMLKLINQRRNDEITYNIGPKIKESDKKVIYERKFNPKSYASIAARATRIEKQRLDKSMELLRQRHEQCFGKSCPNPGEMSQGEDIEALRARKTKKHSQSEKIQPKPVDMSSSTFPERTKDPITLPKSFTTRVPDPIQEKKVETEKDYIEQLKQFTQLEDRAHTARAGTGRTDEKQNSKKEPTKPKQAKQHDPPKPITHFKVPVVIPVPKPAIAAGPSSKNPDVKVLFVHQPEGKNNTQGGIASETTSDQKMGSERWPMEYLMNSASPYDPDLHAKAKEPQKVSFPNDNKMIAEDNKKGRSEWMAQIKEVRKEKAIRDEAKAKAVHDKQKANTKALYHELLLNKVRLKNDVEFEKLKMKESWKHGIKKVQLWNKKDKDKLPERFKTHDDDDDQDDKSSTHVSHNKKPIQYTWKERPKGLNMWLEGVMAKAKEEKEAKSTYRNKDLLIPLSSYQF